MFLVWMPYVRFTDGLYRAPGAPANINVGQAALWPDTIEVWQNQINLPRPAWLEMYRDFPRQGSQEIGEPIFGTVVLGDEAWLTENYRRLIAVLYFLGDCAILQGIPRTGRPSEWFYARPLSIGPQLHDLVEVWTKHGSHIEDQDSLKMTPPLPVRGNHTQYRLDLPRVEHAALVQLLFANPQHRLITACLHYFLAQTGDPLVVSFEQDYANYCAALEAAFNIVQGAPNSVTAPAAGFFRSIGNKLLRLIGCGPATHRATLGIYEQLEAALVVLYGDDDVFKEYCRGLYTCRSIHDHGLSNFGAEEVRQQRHQAYLGFLAKRGNYSVCRAICRDVILRQLWEQPGGARDEMSRLFGFTDSAAGILDRLFYSTEIWSVIRNRANEQQSAVLMSTLADEALEQFRTEVVNFESRFAWQCVDPAPEVNAVRRVIRNLLDAHTRSVAQFAVLPDSPPIADLIAAFRQPNDSDQAIGIWAGTYTATSFDIPSGDRTELLAAAAWCTARFFDR
jgi:hypothetical protein